MVGEFGGRVRTALSLVGESQTRFAARAGTTNGYISEICRGRKRPSLDVLAALVDVGVSGSWLLTGRGAPLEAGEIPGQAAPTTTATTTLTARPDPLLDELHPDLVHGLRRLARASAGKQDRLLGYLERLLEGEADSSRRHAAAGHGRPA